MQFSSSLALTALVLLAAPMLRSGQQTAPTPGAAADAPVQAPLVPATHLGKWTGPNRLWVRDLDNPSRSEGTIDAAARAIDYTWSLEGKQHTGRLELHGQPGAMRAAWVDTWHAANGITLHGHSTDDVIRLYGTYSVGDGVEWGWRIELDLRDRETFDLKMFNVMPEHGVVPAVVLRGKR